MIESKSKSILYFVSSERFFLGITWSLFAPLIPLVALDLKVGLDYIGSAISLSTIGLLILALAIGNLMDILGFKKIIFIGLTLSIIGSLGLFFSGSYQSFVISYFILNIGSMGIINISTMALIGSYYFDSKSKNLLKINIVMGLGSVIAPLLVSLILKLNISWHFLYLIMVIPQIALFIWFLFIKIPEHLEKRKSIKMLIKDHKNVITTPLFLLYCFMILIYESIMSTFSTWFTTYFSGLNVELSISSLFLSIYTISLMAGMIIKNYLIGFLKERRLLVYSVFLSLLFFLLIFFTNNLVAKIIFISLFGISICGIFSIIYSLSLDIGIQYTNTASGIIYAFSYVGAIIFQYLSGYLSEHFSKNSVLYIDVGLIFALLVLSLIIYTKSGSRPVFNKAR